MATGNVGGFFAGTANAMNYAVQGAYDAYTAPGQPGVQPQEFYFTFQRCPSWWLPARLSAASSARVSARVPARVPARLSAASYAAASEWLPTSWTLPATWISTAPYAACYANS